MNGPKVVLKLQRVTEVSDNQGGFTQTWADVADITGVMSTLSDRERMMYGKKAESADYKFSIDYMFANSATAKDRFTLGSRIFDIDGVENPMQQNRFLIFLISEHCDG